MQSLTYNCKLYYSDYQRSYMSGTLFIYIPKQLALIYSRHLGGFSSKTSSAVRVVLTLTLLLFFFFSKPSSFTLVNLWSQTQLSCHQPVTVLNLIKALILDWCAAMCTCWMWTVGSQFYSLHLSLFSISKYLFNYEVIKMWQFYQSWFQKYHHDHFNCVLLNLSSPSLKAMLHGWALFKSTEIHFKL